MYLLGGKRAQEYYDSLIGIVTAICGNILISIALNTQRYAHIELNERQNKREGSLKRAERRAGTLPEDDSGGTEHVSRHSTAHDKYFIEHDERQPLLEAYQSQSSEHESDVAENEARESLSHKSYLKSPYWWAGIIMMAIGEAGNFLAYGFAPASIVSPLGVVAIVSNCIIAPFFMKEAFRWRDFWGVMSAVAGAVTVVFSARQNNPKLGPHEMWNLIATWEFETYLGITTALIICLMLASNRYGDKSIFIDLGLVGLFGGYTALSTKGVASLFSYTLFQALRFPVTYLLVTILTGTAVMQIKYINRALQRFDATQVIPTQFVLFTLSVILGSAILYRDFERTDGDDAGKFFGGCAMTFIGVWLITSARPQPSQEGEEYDEYEEAINLRGGEEYHDDSHIQFDESHASISDTLTSTLGGPSEMTRSVFEARNHPYMSESVDRDTWTSGSSASWRPPVGGASTPLHQQLIESTDNPQTLGKPRAQPGSVLPTVLLPFKFLVSRISRQGLPLVQEGQHSIQDIPSTLSDSSALVRGLQIILRNSDDCTSSSNACVDNFLQLDRQSRSTVYPGPFTSPLSSSLSAMIADDLRKGTNYRAKRRRSGRPRLQNVPYGASREQYTMAPGVLPLRPASSLMAHELSGFAPSIRRTQSQDVRSHPSVRVHRRSLSSKFGRFLHQAYTPTTQQLDQSGEGNFARPDSAV